MAGIGFELKRLLREDNFSALARAYAIGAVYVLGPFLCSVLSILSLGVLTRGVAELDVRQAFTSAVVWAFVGSLTATGLVQVVLTRHLADLVYSGDEDRLVDAFFPVTSVVVLLSSLVAVPALVAIDVPLSAKLVGFGLNLTLSVLWITVVFATSVERHLTVVAIFLVGSILGLASARLLVRPLGLTGLLLGYSLGHFAMLALLVRFLFQELGLPRRWDLGIFESARRHPELMLVGVLQPLGVWVDKILFWGSELGVSSMGLVTAPKYDSSTFLAYLTALPAMVHFFVRIEAEIAELFHGYYDQIFFKGDFEGIRRAGASLKRAIFGALLAIIKLQAVITFLAAFFAADILAFLGLPVSQVGMFRFAAVGSLFLVLLLFVTVVLLYLDRSREVLATFALLFLGNGLATHATLSFGYASYGLGFAFAALVAMVFGLERLARELHNLDFRTFTNQPLQGAQAARKSLRARGGGFYGEYHPVGEETR